VNKGPQCHEAEWRNSAAGIRFYGTVYSSNDPHPDAQRSPLADRRGEPQRRSGERRQLVLVPPLEQRSRGAQRRTEERRTGTRLGGKETAEEHVRNALQLLMTIAETGSLGDEVRRDLDAAIFRLRFAIDRLRA
jgi:hypothetical protein